MLLPAGLLLIILQYVAGYDHSYKKQPGFGCGGYSRDCRVRLTIGEGGTYKSSTGSTVEQCSTTCNKAGSDCGGFEYDSTTTRCSFRTNTLCNRVPKATKDCYTKVYESPTFAQKKASRTPTVTMAETGPKGYGAEGHVNHAIEKLVLASKFAGGLASGDTVPPYTNLVVEFNTAVQDAHLQKLFFTRLTTPRTKEMANFTCSALNRGGNCSIRFATRDAGDYSLVVTLWGLHIAGSPLRFTAEQSLPPKQQQQLPLCGRNTLEALRNHGYWEIGSCCHIMQYSEYFKSNVPQHCCDSTSSTLTSAASTHLNTTSSFGFKIDEERERVRARAIDTGLIGAPGMWWRNARCTLHMFTAHDARKCLDMKHIVFAGDSFTRNLWKALIWLVDGSGRAVDSTLPGLNKTHYNQGFDEPRHARSLKVSIVYVPLMATRVPSSVIQSLVRPLSNANITTTGPNAPVYVNIAIGVHVIGNHYRGAKTENAYRLKAEKAAEAGLVYASDLGGLAGASSKELQANLKAHRIKLPHFMQQLRVAFPGTRQLLWRSIHATPNLVKPLVFGAQDDVVIQQFNDAQRTIAKQNAIPYFDVFPMTYAAGPESHYQGAHQQRWVKLMEVQAWLNWFCA